MRDQRHRSIHGRAGAFYEEWSDTLKRSSMEFIKKILRPAILTERERIVQEWDRQRARALTPSDAAEIDAIFSRAL